jgi:DNA invertase Pin-like site-specific DNA recombinase
MLSGYVRASKADGSQVLDLQRAALLAAGVTPQKLYEDPASGWDDDRPGLAECLESLHTGDTLVVWKLDRLDADLPHLVNLVHDLSVRGIGLKVLTGEGAAIDTTAPDGRLVPGFFAALAECERELLAERTPPGPARARGIPRKMTAAQLLIAQAAMGKPETKVSGLCAELGISAQTLYRHVDPRGELRPDSLRLLGERGIRPSRPPPE